MMARADFADRRGGWLLASALLRHFGIAGISMRRLGYERSRRISTAANGRRALRDERTIRVNMVPRISQSKCRGMTFAQSITFYGEMRDSLKEIMSARRQHFSPHS